MFDRESRPFYRWRDESGPKPPGDAAGVFEVELSRNPDDCRITMHGLDEFFRYLYTLTSGAATPATSQQSTLNE